MAMNALDLLCKQDLATTTAALFVTWLSMEKLCLLPSMPQSTQPNARPVYAGTTAKSDALLIVQLMETGDNGDSGANVTRPVVEARGQGQGVATAQNQNAVETHALEIAMRSRPATNRFAKNAIPMNNTTMSPTVNPLANPSALTSMTAQHASLRTHADAPQASTEGTESASA